MVLRLMSMRYMIMILPECISETSSRDLVGKRRPILIRLKMQSVSSKQIHQHLSGLELRKRKSLLLLHSKVITTLRQCMVSQLSTHLKMRMAIS